MRITCPDCSATYDVPESLLAGSRPVRCVRCSGEWVPRGTAAADPALQAPSDAAGPEPEAAPPDALDAASAPGLEERVAAPDAPWPSPTVGVASAPPAPGAEGVTRLVALSPPAWRTPGPVVRPPPPPAQQAAAWIGWALTAVILVALLWGGYAGRDAVMRAWPPAIRLYAALGLAGR